MIILQFAIFIVIVTVAYVGNGLRPFTEPISNIALYQNGWMYQLVTITMVWIWIHQICFRGDGLQKLICALVIIANISLTIFSIKAGGVHERCAALSIISMSVYCLRNSISIGDLAGTILCSLPIMVSPIMISRSDVAVTVVEILALICIGIPLILNEYKIVIIKSAFLANLQSSGNFDIQRILILGGTWMAISTLSILSILGGRIPWFGMLFIGVCQVISSILAYKIYRGHLVTGIIVFSLYLGPIVIIQGLAGHGSISFSMGLLTFGAIVMLALSFLYDEYIEDIL